MNIIDTMINKVTMYRLLLYYLLAIIATAMVCGAVGILPYSPVMIVLSAVLAVGICYVANKLFSTVYDAPTNSESSILTGLILTLIITPIQMPKDALFIIAAAGLAVASKYIVAVRHKHLFNPAAIAVVLTAFGPQETASWWVGSACLLPVVVIGGLLVVRKIRRTEMVATFIGVALLSTAFFGVLSGHGIGPTVQTALTHSSLFFLAFAMLTEPWTSPTSRNKRFLYAGIVGLLFSPAIHIGSIYSTPELALVIGNLAAFFVSPMVKTKVRFLKRHNFGSQTEDLEFIPEKPFTYRPGQYIEMTLPHSHGDARGMRRYFTLASSPTERTLRIGIRYYEYGSSFKHALQDMNEQTPASFGQLGGDFTLPTNPAEKLAFIAGGIGITPFRSMVKYLDDTNDPRSVVLLYGERTAKDVAYKEVFEAARAKQIKTTYVLSATESTDPHVVSGRIDAALLKERIPDYKERLFYISGPQTMVTSMKAELHQLGVPSHRIKIDYFFGY